MKIAFVCNEYPPAPAGGIGTWTRAIANALADRGDSVWIVGVYKDLRQRIDETDNRVQVIRLPASRLPKWQVRAVVDRLKIRSALVQLRRQVGLDIVEIPDYGGYGLFYKNDCPLVVRLHDPDGWGSLDTPPVERSRFLHMHWCAWQTLRKADRIVAVSAGGLSAFQQRYPQFLNSTMIYYNIADVFLDEAEPPVSREAHLVLFVGTLAERKGIWELAAAWREVKQRVPEARLVMIGKDQQPAGQAQSNRQRLEVELAGLDVTILEHQSQAELSRWYRRAAAACFPSKRETFGLVAAEAMACGAPLIYTKYPPGPEVTGQGSRGLLVDPDDPADIAQAICDLLENPVPQDRVEAGREWVRSKMSAAATLMAARQLYAQLLDKR